MQNRLSCRLSWLSLMVLMFATFSASAAEPVVDRLGVPGPQVFAGKQYLLSWSSHPAADLYKQEYLPAGQDANHYLDMFMIDVRLDGAEAAQMAAGINAQVQARKASDPTANAKTMVSQDGRQAIVDMLMSDKDEKGQAVVEWSAHRYIANKSGQGTTMIGISRRAYGDKAVIAFLKALKQRRQDDINALANLALPAVELAH